MISGFSETFRGDVKAWECDVVEHFTVAFYYEKFEAAGWRFLRDLGVDPGTVRTTDCYTRYLAELRKGDLFHIESGLVEPGPRPIIAHRLLNTESGTLCTLMEQTLDGVALYGSRAGRDGPAREERPSVSPSAKWVRTGMDVVRTRDLDWTGKLGLGGLIHRFSGSSSHALATIGMSPSYLRENRRGFSTFELRCGISMQEYTPNKPVRGMIAAANSTLRAYELVARSRLVTRAGSRQRDRDQ